MTFPAHMHKAISAKGGKASQANRPSLRSHVADLVTERREADVDQILPDCEGYTRDQVIHALQEAKTRGYIRIVRRGKSGNRFGGSTPSTYGLGERASRPPPKEPARERVNSVFQLGDLAANVQTTHEVAVP